MFLKLLAYDSKETFKKVNMLYLAGLIIAFFIHLSAHLGISNTEGFSFDTLSGSLLFFSTLGVVLFVMLSVISFVVIFRSYYNSMYGKQAVFYRMLPVSYMQRVISKILSWIFLNVATLLYVFAILLSFFLHGIFASNQTMDIALLWEKMLQVVDIKSLLLFFGYFIVTNMAGSILFALRAFFLIHVVNLGGLRHSRFRIPLGALVWVILSYVEDFILSLFPDTFNIFALHSLMGLPENESIPFVDLIEPTKEATWQSLVAAAPMVAISVIALLFVGGIYAAFNRALYREVDL